MTSSGRSGLPPALTRAAPDPVPAEATRSPTARRRTPATWPGSPRSRRRSARPRRRVRAGVPGRHLRAPDDPHPEERSLHDRRWCGPGRRAAERRRKAVEHLAHLLHALRVSRAADLPGPRPLARQRVRRARHHADGKTTPRAGSGSSAPRSRRSQEPGARSEEVEDQHRVADVDAELAPLAEARRRLGVVAEHLARAETLMPRTKSRRDSAFTCRVRMCGTFGSTAMSALS